MAFDGGGKVELKVFDPKDGPSSEAAYLDFRTRGNTANFWPQSRS